jgi:hypothetical protein
MAANSLPDRRRPLIWNWAIALVYIRRSCTYGRTAWRLGYCRAIGWNFPARRKPGK